MQCKPLAPLAQGKPSPEAGQGCQGTSQFEMVSAVWKSSLAYGGSMQRLPASDRLRSTGLSSCPRDSSRVRPAAPAVPPSHPRSPSEATGTELSLGREVSLPQHPPNCSLPFSAPGSGPAQCREGCRGWMWPEELEMQCSASKRTKTQLHACTHPAPQSPALTIALPGSMHPFTSQAAAAATEAAVPTSSCQEKLGDARCPAVPLTTDVEVVLGHDTAHGAGGCADVGAAVALVEEGEDEDAVRAQLQGRIAALLLPQELLRAAEWDSGEAPPFSPAPWVGWVKVESLAGQWRGQQRHGSI